jgi:hypothetical protein
MVLVQGSTASTTRTITLTRSGFAFLRGFSTQKYKISLKRLDFFLPLFAPRVPGPTIVGFFCVCEKIIVVVGL